MDSQSGAPGGRTCSGQPGGTLAPTPGSLPQVEHAFDPTRPIGGRGGTQPLERLSQNCSKPQVPAPLEW